MRQILDELNPFFWMTAVYLALMVTVQHMPSTHAALMWSEGLDPQAFMPIDR